MKTVVTSDMVAHLWANQSQSEARNKQGNFYFRDSTIYSYGSHFPIARHVTGKNKTPLVLLTTQSYSVTTGAHISTVRSAARHLNVIHCHNVQAESKSEHISNLKTMREDHAEALLKAARSRTRIDGYVGRAETLSEEHLAYRQAFGLSLDKPLTIPEDWKADSLERVKRLKVAEAKKNEKIIEDTLHVLKFWKQGQEALLAEYEGKERPRYNVQLVPVALRVNGEEIETSRGARVPLAHGKRIWARILKIRETQTAYQQNGHTEYAGPFAINAISTGGQLRVGCHTIEFSAMKELADKLGW